MLKVVVNDESREKVIYTIAVMCMIVIWCCCEMFGMVVVMTEDTSVHVPSSCKLGAGILAGASRSA